MATITELPKTMKAIYQPSLDSHKLILKELPVPTPTHPDDVLVKVHATSPCLGELDWAPFAPELFAAKVPIAGQDVCGRVVTAPAGSKFQPGDEVYARIPATRPGGGAEYALVRTTELACKPKTLSFVEAAATPLSALTAYQALFVKGGLDAAALHGDAAARQKHAALRVLITAAAGSVGGWAVQFAKRAGVGAIVAVNSGRATEAVRQLGATEVVDYTQQTVAEWARADPAAREVDLVVDCIGRETQGYCWHAVKGDGRFISVCGPPEQSKPEGVEKPGVHSEFFVVESLGDNLESITEMIDEGALRPLIDSVVEFEDFEAAWEKVESGHAKGKVIIKVDGQV